ncbi:MAG: choice-of-anchor X domain-containing protein, partial [Melioribacteraceae bacterium]
MLKKATRIILLLMFVFSVSTLKAQDSLDISVTYQVDMELEFLKGSFDPATDTVEVRGSYFGWGSEAPDMIQSAVNPNIYEHTATQRAAVGDSLPAYKFYYTQGNWEGGDNKFYQITQADYDAGFAVVARPFNDATLDDVINQDATILFTVNTSGAMSSINNTAFSTVNTVHITGAVTPLKWPDGGWPDAQIDRMIPLYDNGTNGDETSGDGIFSANVTFPQ